MTNPNPPKTLDEPNKERCILCPPASTTDKTTGFREFRKNWHKAGHPKLDSSISPTKPDIDEEIIEQLAAIEHERWADWQKYVHNICELKSEGLLIPNKSVRHWNRQIQTQYSNLSEAEKQSDRDQVARYLPLLQNLIIKERQAELAQTVLAGMPELTPKQQEFVENRLQELEKTLKESTDV